MHRMRRPMATALVSALLLAGSATPSAAFTNAALTIANGEMEVGKGFSEHCGKDGDATVTGRGLYFPNLKTTPGRFNGKS